MPSSVRKSSIGTSRRGPQKAHIPYRGDNPEVGKKTGIAVQHVERLSDGFEPFEVILRQADKKTPPTKVRTKKRKQVPPSPAVEDEDGEMSMDMDDSNPNSPMRFFANARPPAAPQSVNRVGSSSRPANRSSAVDFDQVPSPRPRIAASKRKSLTNGSAAGPSKLKQNVIADPDPDPDIGDPGPEVDDGGMGDGFDDYGPQENGSPDGQSPRQTSFVQMDRDDDDDDEEDDEQGQEESPIPVSKKNSKGKERERPPEEAEEEQVEEEIAQGLDDSQRVESDQDEEEHAPPPKKKVRMEQQNGKRPRGRSKKGEFVEPEHSETPEGVRRGQRHRYRPLEWWRQEKVVYGKRESGISLVPHIKAILRIPKEEPVPLGGGKQKRKRSTRPRSKSETVVVEERPFNPEEGWDDKTPQQGVVIDFVSKEEVQRRIAFTANMVEPRAAANNDWFFQKVFGDGDFIAAGQLIIPPKGRKPSKGTKDNTYIFYVIEGAVNLRVHDTSLILATGGMFMVPRGNTYFIENIADRDAKLFFTQARKIAMDEEEQAANMGPLPPGTPVQPRRSSEMRRLSDGPAQHRSSSVGTGPNGQVNGHVGGVAAGGKKPDSKAVGSKRAASTKI